MAKSLVEILHVVPLTGVAKQSGNHYDMRLAQCIVHQLNKETGVVEPLVGELVLPAEYKELQRGMYEVDFRLSISRHKRVESVVDTMTPYVPKATAKAQGNDGAKAAA